jgi:RNA-directed DNA polymerase
LKQVRANKGAPGIDKITVNQIGGYLNRHWTKIKAALLDGSHKPLPVRRKQIDKPDGEVRLLGIPTVLDRIIQQAIAQVVEQIWDPTFSKFSYGFRPGRSAHDAVLQSKQYLLDGYTYVVDMDLSKFLGQGQSRPVDESAGNQDRRQTRIEADTPLPECRNHDRRGRDLC